MKSRKRARKFIILFVGFLILLVIGGAILIFSAAEPPVETIGACREALSRARLVEAEHYSPLLLQKAEKNWEAALDEWKFQNDRWFFIRNYEKTRLLATEATALAREAEEKAMNAKDSLQHDMSQALKITGKTISVYEENLSGLPLDKSVRNDFTNGKLKYLECKRAFERGDYNKVRDNLEYASRLVNKADQKARHMLDDYFDSYPSWKKWGDETISWSKSKKATAILIDKLAHKCFVYKDGKLRYEFQIELGSNWIGDKRYRGDKATPEGKYHITKKKNHRETKYYKALLIDYPNDEDQQRYRSEIKNGTISGNRSIGNLIEIHGDGGQGINWTDGCIALTNNEMDKIYGLAGVGTPVTIVGSLRSMKQLEGN
jgi:hypothetical protein